MFCKIYEVEIDYEITVEESLKAIGEKDGIAVLFHPGRYRRVEVEKHCCRWAEWYIDLYNNYDHLIGLEVYNGKDGFPRDR